MHALDDIRVLDFTQIVAGPTCTQYLGAFGAEIIKVEPPDGDRARRGQNGSYHSSFNLGGKKSISVDLKTEEGLQLVHDIAKTTDVIVENFRPGVIDQFELGYDDVQSYNPDIVYCSISGFGQDGPYTERPSLDPIAQAHSGLIDMTGYPDEKPARIGTSALDITTGMIGAFGITLGLQERDKTGESQYIDVSLFETAISWMAYWVARYQAEDQSPSRNGDGLGPQAPYGLFKTNDGYIYLIAHRDHWFSRLCDAIDREDLLEDERFTSEQQRENHTQAIQDILEAEFASYTNDELAELLAVEYNIPCGPVKSVEDLVEDDPQIAARNMLTDTYNMQSAQDTVTANLPFKFNDSRPDLGERPPKLGEHSIHILSEFGYDEAQIEKFVSEEIIQVPE